ncbi:MAG: glutamate--tRNA ligase [Candidatus Paracaedimonas acanthamoebae]|uniref:Glutamate--tRNA ligase n=1 Tax=Candidatus Paracaedimonas acanthamoebae TaxID=244581 RepID=A0A8J7PS96_9PROT|nr:glutamate--tRNA ligase [Candidatus Paracaedimonas acanthamoebae]
MTVVTRFAPSPTGYLHIGGARTALFNWLYAKHLNGKFLLRIEDTDRERSTDEAIKAIIESMKWLGLKWDDDIIFQFSRAQRHAEVAHQLVAEGKAYYCFCTPEELENMREKARQEKRQPRYDGRWRDRDIREAPLGVKPVIRLRVPYEGETGILDVVQGQVRVQNEQLDDMVLLRADGTPTYMLAVVVDDHDMKITHVIRGDDHLTNTFRQIQIYKAMGWNTPTFAHIPMIHGHDGAKLSKRHGALGVEAYQEMGFLPEAMCNYLLRLGWGYGNEEIISQEQAIRWFDIQNVGRSPARFDIAKLKSVNAHYLNQSNDRRLSDLISPFIEEKLGKHLNEVEKSTLETAMPGLKQRAQTITELADSALFYVHKRPIFLDDKARHLLEKEAKDLLQDFLPKLMTAIDWSHDSIQEICRIFSENRGIKLGQIAQPLRAAITGRSISPSIFEVMEVLGQEECLGRLQDVLGS